MSRHAGPGMSAVGILGGTFDPVHCAHLRIALDVLERCQLDQVRLLPNARSPFREQSCAGHADRLAMLSSAVADEPRLVVDNRELGRADPSYTVDSLRELRAELGTMPLCFILGADAFSEFHRWHEWQAILGLAHLVIAGRPGCELAIPDPGLQAAYSQRHVTDWRVLHEREHGSIYTCDVTQLAVSATDVRQRIKRGETARWLVPDVVWEYIQQHRLYQ